MNALLILLAAVPFCFLTGMGLAAAMHRIETSPPLLPYWSLARLIENIVLAALVALWMLLCFVGGDR